MAQIVILAPKGEDVEAGKTALEGAGHEVEVIEADAVHLLHLALGMLEGDDEPAAEELPAEELPAEEPEELPAEEEPKAEDISQRGEVALLDDLDFSRLSVVVSHKVKTPWLAAPLSERGFAQVCEGLEARANAAGYVSLSIGSIVDKDGRRATVSARLTESNKRVLYLDPETASRVL